MPSERLVILSEIVKIRENKYYVDLVSFFGVLVFRLLMFMNARVS